MEGTPMRRLTMTLPLLAFSVGLASSVFAVNKLDVDLQDIKSALAGITISQGPDTAMKTRSAWGPELYKRTVDATILVLVYGRGESGKAELVGTGSGVLVSENGLAFTNWHVTWPQEKVLVVLYPGNGRSYDSLQDHDVWLARVLKTEQSRDVSLLKLERPINEQLSRITMRHFLKLEDPNMVEVGQDVFAIGHPVGLHWTYTEGVISQIRPRFAWEAEGSRYQATVIQTQTAVSFGSSGGPLINRNGKLVGIISSKGDPGFNFAISVHELRNFLARTE